LNESSHIPGANAVTASTAKPTADPWLKLAKDAFSRSTNYFDNNYKKQWEDNLRMFQSKHPRDSKYNSDAYKFRSRIFRPKSRSVVRKNEATAALAFFSNPDVVSVDPVDDENEAQAWSALVMKELLQYRLTKTLPWFLLAVGGFQDAMTVGLVASLQSWRYRAKMVKQTVQGYHPDFGVVTAEQEVPNVIEDRPDIALIPIENIRFDPAAHWFDVVGTSPYTIIQMPMYVNDVLDNMESEDRAGNSWKRHDKKVILNARVSGLDPLRQARNENREDAQDITSDVNEFDVVMVHLNFVKTGDETYAYYTLKDTHLLTEPMPVGEMFLHCTDGRPPVQIGFCVIETHKPVPTSKIGLTEQLQREANEVSNQRLDNVKFVLNKRWIIKRGANVDVESLMRNVPGGATMVGDIEKDIRAQEWQDVTSSSYQEQDRINLDFDDLAGNFSQGSVMTNRKLNETVGGMRMMAQGANMLTEYDIRVYVETWVEPVLRQLAKMEQAYETDERVLAIAGQKAGLFQKFGQSADMDLLLAQDLTLSVNVGMGATDPDTRLQRFMQALMLDGKVAKEGAPDTNLKEVRKMLFGLSGFKDSSRFFNKQVDVRLVQAQQMMAEAESKAKEIINQVKDQLQTRARQLDNREHELDLKMLEEQMNFQGEAKKLLQEFILKTRDQEFQHDLKTKQATQGMQLDRAKAGFQMQLAEDKANHEAGLKSATAQHDAALKSFEAGINALVAKFEANTERMVAEAKAAAGPKEKKAKKLSDGTWQITEKSAA
jgi:hypothetical protein